MRSGSGIESAFIPRSWRSLVQPRMGRQFIAWRRQPQGIPNEPTIILSPRGGGRGNSRQGRRWCRVARADRDSQVSALGVGLPSGTPFRCRHRIKHRKRAPGQRGLRVGANLLSRNLDGNQIAWKYRRCAGHANLLFRDGVKRQVGKCDCLLEFTTRPELSQSRARIWPQQHVPKRLKNSATRNSTARSQNRRLAICMA
jgi:hypothetical protein